MTQATATPTILKTRDERVVFNGCQIRTALDLYIKIKMIVQRGVTISKLLEAASGFTGKQYKNTAKGWAEAHADMVEWVNGAKAEMGFSVTPKV